MQNSSQHRPHSSELSTQWKSEEAELFIHQLQDIYSGLSGWYTQSAGRECPPQGSTGICRKWLHVEKRWLWGFEQGLQGCFRICMSSQADQRLLRVVTPLLLKVRSQLAAFTVREGVSLFQVSFHLTPRFLYKNPSARPLF